MSATRLAVYGSLRPGGSNHRQLAGLRGVWSEGTVRGWLRPEGWAAGEGYAGLRYDPNGPEVKVWLFESEDLPGAWERLDEFEGEDYRRIAVSVDVDGRSRLACLYVVRE